MRKRNKIIKLFEMFAGYGGASFALKKAGIPFECVGVSEIDKYAMQCYTQNHKGFHYGDCTKINPNELPDFDLLTGGFPCQAFSVAGKGLGELDTRGTLFNEIIRIAEVKKPKWMLLENVKGLTTKKHKPTFDKILSELKRIGYDVKYKILNSKEHGIPQNRERIFFVCKLGQWDFMGFQFPQKEELKIFLKDILEDQVDEKYYLNEKQVNKILNSNFQQEKLRIQGGKISNTLLSRDYKSPKCVRINGLYDSEKKRHQAGSIYDKNGVSPSLDTGQGGNRQPFIVVSRGRNTSNSSDRTVGSPTKYKTSINKMYESSLTIRKLTPKECFRLMGFLDDEINLNCLSNTQKYKLAGNGWDINLVSKIFKEMFK